MSKTAVVTARLATQIVEDLDRLAAHCDRSRAYLISKAVQRFIEQEAELHDFIQVGIEAADRGDVVSQSEMEAWFEGRLTNRALAIAAE